ncbi:hypothetical protein [Bifidobacterium sp. SO1]|uniref:hypothetical protein n=1 Tax=Bifidobacterium sp. SO1 TaxID=2809029 RepID=UPI001BDC0D66|nr:hypothetical protein [Bifidobacterium sp. SO1]MBT1161239.1 hypothetical protein [Bifidobacterium sp. SO1]
MNDLEKLWDMVSERGLAELSQTTTVGENGTTCLFTSFAIRCGENALYVVVPWTTLQDVADVLRERLESYDVDTEGRRLMDSGVGIMEAAQQAGRVRNKLESIVGLADELLHPTSSYCVVKHVVTEESASFDGPAGMDPDEAERWFGENVDEDDLNWMGGDVIDSSIENVTEEE